MTSDRDDLLALARNVDRFTRLLHVSTRPKAKIVDHARIGPFGAMVLMTISDHEPLPVLRLASLLARDKAQMTRAIQVLERNGLIERHQSAEDGRVSLVRLSEEGRALVIGFTEILAASLEDLMTDLKLAERGQFEQVLKKMLRAASTNA